jgi:aromatic ring-cleaving dioxygenase
MERAWVCFDATFRPYTQHAHIQFDGAWAEVANQKRENNIEKFSV